MKQIPILIFSAFAVIGFLPELALATSIDYFPTGGLDVSDGTPAVFDENALSKISASDDTRIQSDGNWPTDGSYDENKYIEFSFSSSIADGTVINSVSITHEFRRTSTLTAAKLEVWDGGQFIDVPLTLPSIVNSDLSETKDVSSYLNTPTKLNSLKARFLAYRSTAVTTNKTSHDFIKLTVDSQAGTTSTPTPTSEPSYPSTPEPMTTPAPTPAPTPVPAVSPTPTPTAKPTKSPTPTPTPTATLTASPTPSQTPVVLKTDAPFVTPPPAKISKAVAKASPTSSQSISPSPTPLPSLEDLTASVATSSTLKWWMIGLTGLILVTGYLIRHKRKNQSG